MKEKPTEILAALLLIAILTFISGSSSYVAAAPIPATEEAADEAVCKTADSYVRNKHSITLSAGPGISAANVSSGFEYKGVYLSEGFRPQNSFVAELAYMYRINGNLGIEPFVSYSAEKQSLVTSIGSFSLEYSALAAGGNVLGILPSGNVDIYALAGLLYIYNSFDFSSGANALYSEKGGSLGLQGGVGVDYIFNNRIRAGLRGVYRYNKPIIGENSVNLSKFIMTARIGVDF